MKEVQQEITPITKEDLFIIMNHPNAKFDYPIHCHPEYEINLVMDTRGTRIIGEQENSFSGLDLVLTGPYLPHVWKAETQTNQTITIQFSGDLGEFNVIGKRLFAPIRQVLEESKCGLAFHGAAAVAVKERIISLTSMHGFHSALEFFDILNMLAESKRERITDAYDPELFVRQSKSRRISQVCKYIDDNLGQDIKMSEVAKIVNMSESAFSHFFKKRTNISFKTYLTNLRISRACNLLASTTLNASEICYDCGFNNKSNFNRIFSKNKNMSPIAYRRYITELLIKY